MPDFLGRQKVFKESKRRTGEPGVSTGLAWTPSGGDILFIEARSMPGTGHLTLTGQLGDVMKESAQAALTYIRSIADSWGVADDFFQKHDIHVHVPAGAVPKDGPSAGVAITTALASMITGRPVNADVAMTGEVTLTGQVLPVGGIKEKVLAAGQAGITTIFLPDRNENGRGRDQRRSHRGRHLHLRDPGGPGAGAGAGECGRHGAAPHPRRPRRRARMANPRQTRAQGRGRRRAEQASPQPPLPRAGEGRRADLVEAHSPWTPATVTAAYRELDHPADLLVEVRRGSPSAPVEQGSVRALRQTVELRTCARWRAVPVAAEGPTPWRTLCGGCLPRPSTCSPPRGSSGGGRGGP